MSRRLLVSLALLPALTAHAQPPASSSVVKAKAELAPRAKPPVPGGLVTVNVVLTIEDGWHIYANPAGDETARPTVVAPDPKAPVRVLAIDYPPGVALPQPGDAPPVLVYEPSATIPMRLQLRDDVPPGPLELPLQVRYQPCNDRACLAPATLKVVARLEVQPR
jgi:DsbC/DsbD-like thiol-disulfide interchange protein